MTTANQGGGGGGLWMKNNSNMAMFQTDVLMADRKHERSLCLTFIAMGNQWLRKQVADYLSTEARGVNK